MAAQRTGSTGSGIFQNEDPEAFEEEFCLRMIVSAAGLPRSCPLKKCRRRKRCFGRRIDDLMCLRHHNGLSRERFEAALRRLGWRNCSDPPRPPPQPAPAKRRATRRTPPLPS